MLPFTSVQNCLYPESITLSIEPEPEQSITLQYKYDIVYNIHLWIYALLSP